MPHRAHRSRRALTTIVLAGAMGVPAAADAPAASISSQDDVVILGGTDDDESVGVSQFNGSLLRVRVLGNPLFDYQSVEGCSFLGAPPFAVNGVACGAHSVQATLARGDDVFAGYDAAGQEADLAGPATVDGGGGMDKLFGGAADDKLSGSTNKDRLTGGLGSDTLSGEEGDDYLIGDDPRQSFVDPDTIDGGPDRDIVDYGDRTQPLTLSLDGNANDGQHGGAEGDNLIDVEIVRGGEGDDRVTGSNGADRISGNGGADVIFGLSGNDRLIGNDGPDALHGNADDDRLEGWGGRDVLVGAGGDDTLVGGIGKDTYSAGPGDDRVFSKDGVAEDVNCGTGHDFVRADTTDTLHACESVSHQ